MSDQLCARVRVRCPSRCSSILIPRAPHRKTNALVAARALVHSRAVAANFKVLCSAVAVVGRLTTSQAHHATMSAAKREDITTRSVRAKLRLDAQPRQRNLTQFDANDFEPQPSRIPVRADTLPNGLHARAATETPRSVSDSTLHHARTGTTPSAASGRPESPSVRKDDALPPPPPPPKDPDRDSWVPISSPTSMHHHTDSDAYPEPPSPTTTIPSTLR